MFPRNHCPHDRSCHPAGGAERRWENCALVPSIDTRHLTTILCALPCLRPHRDQLRRRAHYPRQIAPQQDRHHSMSSQLVLHNVPNISDVLHASLLPSAKNFCNGCGNQAHSHVRRSGCGWNCLWHSDAGGRKILCPKPSHPILISPASRSYHEIRSQHTTMVPFRLHLLHWLCIRRDAKEIIRRLRDSLSEIKYLPHDWSDSAEDDYMAALQGVFLTIFRLAVLGTISSLFMKEHTLHKDMARRRS